MYDLQICRFCFSHNSHCDIATQSYTQNLLNTIDIYIYLRSYQTWSSSCETKGCHQCHQMSQMQWHGDYFYW